MRANYVKISKQNYDIAEAKAKQEAIVFRIREINSKLIELNIKQFENKISKQAVEDELVKLSCESIDLEKEYVRLQSIIYPQNQPE